ncbi:ATP-dependent DNA helicase mph1 [Golovinomyces cichoracearum]|uniref:ATP-dependent DNA helicase n=1 Tax=Golovinomyces cichoracearum TaxID=62708 RepID=A0A420J417_9PEZI|nr:ATP-dependent DNA helicase mph1 [Golovinomyces cichoracearum]
MNEEEFDDIPDEELNQIFSRSSPLLPSEASHTKRCRRISDSEDNEQDIHFGGDNDDLLNSAFSYEKERHSNICAQHNDGSEPLVPSCAHAEASPCFCRWKSNESIHKRTKLEVLATSSAQSIIPEQSIAIMAVSEENKKDILFVEPIDAELEGLPSDAFSSPGPQPFDSERYSPELSPLLESRETQRQRLVAVQHGLRQTTLFGGPVSDIDRVSQQTKKVHNYIVDKPPEPPTHHKLDLEALKTWIYPMNLGAIRDYQYSIVKNGLFHNLLVALPTGLGKTFIAATIMLNYFRWTKTAQIIFVAPTKPLVSQQVDACFNVVGIPRSQTTMLTGSQVPALRAEEWVAKRVFFMTPQTLENDLVSGIADPKKIVLLVIDEAHRATGNYSYVRVVKFLRRFNQSFRILALTATPGSSVEAVQEIIDNLEISKVEIRTEESIDIQRYVHRRDIDQILLDPSDDMITIKNHLAKALQPLVNILCTGNAYWNRDPMALTTFGMVKARATWIQSETGRKANPGLKWMMNSLFSILASVAHSIKLLNFHGISPFYSAIKDFRDGEEQSNKKSGKYKNQVINSPDFKKMMELIESWISKDDFIGHPKMTYLCDTILNHFLDAGEGKRDVSVPISATRVIVFAEYRDSAEDIVRVLNRHGPMIRASVFVGQADSKRSGGMNQKQQLKAITDFMSGTFNVIVATSIGEEGLDIGQVDLIVCYDSSASPIRMLQRMGRTGRKRAGRIVLLLMKGKEEESFIKAKDSYEQMQKIISSGKGFDFRTDLSVRIIPRDVIPVVEKRIIELPIINTQNKDLPEPRRRPTIRKKPPKKFHMPDGVETNFTKATNLTKKINDDSSDLGNTVAPKGSNKNQLALVPSVRSVFLGPDEEKELQQRFQDVDDDDDVQEVSMPDMTVQTVAQRSLRPIGKIKHGKYTKRCVDLFKTLATLQQLSDHYGLNSYQDSGMDFSFEELDMPSLIDESKLRMTGAFNNSKKKTK